MIVKRIWSITGSDGRVYTVKELERPGPISNGRRLRSGIMEYVLADGSDVTDDKPGYWETMSGVLLKKPEDL